MQYRVIYAEPLSVPKPIAGKIVLFEKYRKLDEVLSEAVKEGDFVILAAKEQHPKMLLYANDVVGYIVRYGSITSHLAVVCREINKPLYRYDGKLEDGEHVAVVPYVEPRRNIPDEITVTIRHIKRGGIISQLEYILQFVNQFSSTLKEFGMELRIGEIKLVDEKTIIVDYKIYGFGRLIDEILKNPQYFKKEIAKKNGIGISMLCHEIADVLFKVLANEVGYDRAYRLLRGVRPYWLEASEKYMRIRFNENIRLELELDMNKPRVTDIDQYYRDLADIIKICIQKYEDKDRQQYGFRR